MSKVRPLDRFVCNEEHRMLLDTVSDLSADNRLARAGDGDTDRVQAARSELVGLGLWSLGLPEENGGGGADPATVALAIAGISAAWPALGVAVSHAHAAAVLAEHRAAGAVLTEVASRGRAVAVVDLAGDAATVRDGAFEITRVDAAARAPDLVLLIDDGTVALVPADRVAFGAPLERTGLDGVQSVPAAGRLDAAAARFSVDANAARRLLYRGLTAVAAGVADAAASAAVTYTGERVQFGAPLAALPAVRDAVFSLASGAAEALAAAFAAPDGDVAAAALLDRALDTAVDVAAGAVQAHGGYGYLAEYPAEGLLRDAVSLRAVADMGAVRDRAAHAVLDNGSG